MRIELLALYQKALLGGLGGLFGWGLVVLLVHFPSNTPAQLYARAMVSGALIGLAVGGLCGVWEGWFREQSLRRAGRGAILGGAIGIIAGMVGLFSGELFFSWFGDTMPIVPRAVGWAIFGLLVGASEGLTRRMPQKLAFGAFGGLLGGLVGGSTYEWLAGLVQRIGWQRDFAIAFGGAVGLVILGLFIGFLVGLVEDLLRSAWLVFSTGRLEGQTRTLDAAKPTTLLGRSETADICILGDAALANRHARIVRDGTDYVLEALDGQVLAGVPGKLQPVTRHLLQPGDYFQLGASRAVFRRG